MQIMQWPRGIDANASSENEETEGLLAAAMADASQVEIKAVCADHEHLSSPCSSHRQTMYRYILSAE